MRAYLCVFIGVVEGGTITVYDEIRFGEKEKQKEIEEKFKAAVPMRTVNLTFVCTRFFFRDITTVVGDQILRLKSGKFTKEEFQNICHNLPPDCKEADFKAGCMTIWGQLWPEDKNVQGSPTPTS